ncbi:MAG: FkbM family methyltransferase [Pseudomonadota bacterium]
MKSENQYEEIADYFGVKVLSVPQLGPSMVNRIKDNRYEGREVELSKALFKPGDRIVEMGAGVGIVGAIAAKNTDPDAMVAFEPNESLHDSIRALYAHNGLAGVIDLRGGVVLAEPDPPSTVPFFVRGNFLGSALELTTGQRRAQKKEVRVTPWAQLKSEFRPTALLMDIEGAEREFFRHADLDGIRVAVFEVHRAIYQRDGVQEIKRLLFDSGFSQSDMSGGGVLGFVRT